MNNGKEKDRQETVFEVESWPDALPQTRKEVSMARRVASGNSAKRKGDLAQDVAGKYYGMKPRPYYVFGYKSYVVHVTHHGGYTGLSIFTKGGKFVTNIAV